MFGTVALCRLCLTAREGIAPLLRLRSEFSYSGSTREAPVPNQNSHAAGNPGSHAVPAADHACGGPDAVGRSAARVAGDFAEVPVALARDRIREVGVVEEVEEVARKRRGLFPYVAGRPWTLQNSNLCKPGP